MITGDTATSQSRRAFCSSAILAPVLLLFASGCQRSSSPAKQQDRQNAVDLAKKAEREERIKQSQKVVEQEFIDQLQDLAEIEDELSLYTELIALCKEASKYNSDQMLRFRGRSLENFASKLEKFATKHLPEFKMHYDLPKKTAQDYSPFQKAVGDNQLFLAIEKRSDYLLREAKRK